MEYHVKKKQMRYNYIWVDDMVYSVADHIIVFKSCGDQSVVVG